MRMSRSAKRALAAFLSAFLFCGLGHVLSFGVTLFECFSQFFCGAMLMLWALSVQKRVTDPRLKALLLWIAVFILAFFLLQITKYSLENGSPALQRRTWYAFYIPMMATALGILYVALYIHKPPGERLHPIWGVPGILGVLVAAGIATNDRHFLAFRFHDLIQYEEHTFGPLFFLFFACFGVLMLWAFLLILRKCRRSPAREYRLLPVLPVAALVLYLILNALGIAPRLHGVKLWNIGEVFGFGMVGFLETCIQIGLIPANRDYERLFRLAVLPAVILDGDENPVVRTAAARYPFPEGRDQKIMTHPIHGGSIRWTVDMRHIRELNDQLTETTRQLEARNAYLTAENQTQEEKTELETRNRLYDAIIALVQPRVDRIGAMLREEDFEKRLPRIAVLSAFIKRRSNMALLGADGTLSSEELALAIRESMEYVRLCGVNAAVSAAGTGLFPAGMVTAAYETVEHVIEESLDTLSDLMVSIRAEVGELTIRLLLRAEGFGWDEGELPPCGEGVSRRSLFSEDGPDKVLAFAFAEGGEGG